MNSRSLHGVRQSTSGERIRECLSGHRLFGALPEALLDRLVASALEREYPRGHHLYYAGDPLGYIIIIRSGLVAMTQLDHWGNRRAPIAFGPSDVLGLVTACLQSRWTWTAAAIVDTRVVLLPSDHFYRLYDESLELSHQVARELSRMVLRSEQANVRFAGAPIVSRVAGFLLECCGSDPQNLHAPLVLDLPLSHQDLSLLLGTSRESISRALARLSRANLIAVDGQQVSILRPEALRSVAGS